MAWGCGVMERATAPGLDQGLNQSVIVARLGGTSDGFRSEQGMCEIIMSRAKSQRWERCSK